MTWSEFVLASLPLCLVTCNLSYIPAKTKARKKQMEEVFFRIVARVVSEILMVHLNVGHRAAELPFPIIAM